MGQWLLFGRFGAMAAIGEGPPICACPWLPSKVAAREVLPWEVGASVMPVGSLYEKNGFFVARRVQIQYLRQVTNSI